MEIRVFETADQASRAAAILIASQVTAKPASVLGLATGSSPIPCYQELIRMNEAGLVDFSKVVTYNLDEYVGLSGEHPCSYRYFMNDQLFDHININKEATHVPNGQAEDFAACGAAYDEAIRQAGGLDLQLLGLGRNGHIGFNEPGDVFIRPCHSVQLSESTIEANTRFFDSKDDVPRYAITLGIGSIMDARKVVLIATGASKAQAVHDAVKGDISPRVQASVLQGHHDCIFLLDREAASLL